MTDRVNFDQLALEAGQNVNWDSGDDPKSFAEEDFKVALLIAEDFEEEWVDDMDDAKARWIDGFSKAYIEYVGGVRL